MIEIKIHQGYLFDMHEVVEKPEPDTSLHIMGGPPSETPQWVVDSWMRAAAASNVISPPTAHPE